jgi:chromosome segregation ATPase
MANEKESWHQTTIPFQMDSGELRQIQQKISELNAFIAKEEAAIKSLNEEKLSWNASIAEERNEIHCINLNIGSREGIILTYMAEREKLETRRTAISRTNSVKEK